MTDISGYVKQTLPLPGHQGRNVVVPRLTGPYAPIPQPPCDDDCVSALRSSGSGACENLTICMPTWQKKAFTPDSNPKHGETRCADIDRGPWNHRWTEYCVPEWGGSGTPPDKYGLVCYQYTQSDVYGPDVTLTMGSDDRQQKVNVQQNYCELEGADINVNPPGAAYQIHTGRVDTEVDWGKAGSWGHQGQGGLVLLKGIP